MLAQVLVENRKLEVDIDCDHLPCVLTFGVCYFANNDIFTFQENSPKTSMEYTEGNLPNKIATLFDPIGYLVPFTVRAKPLLQVMRTASLESDSELSESANKICTCAVQRIRPLETVTDTKMQAGRG